MIEAYIDPLSLSYGLVITRILEDCDLSLSVVPSILVKQCYNATTFASMGYILLMLFGFENLKVSLLGLLSLSNCIALLLFILLVLHQWMSSYIYWKLFLSLTT